MSTQLLDTPSKHRWSVVGLADKAWNATTERIIGFGWRPLTRLAEAGVVAYVFSSLFWNFLFLSSLLSLMQNISKGHLRVLTYEHIYNFPALSKVAEPTEEEGSHLKAELRVTNEVFWIRLVTMSDLGFAEAYMYGEVECDDLVALFEVSLLSENIVYFSLIFLHDS